MVTIKEIAARAGVGFQTVSSALNGDLSRVSRSRQKMILRLAKEMGYHSNLAAKSLRTRKSYAIGILLPSPLDMFYASMVAEFQGLLRESEYTGTFSFWSSYDDIRAATKNILARSVDAIITVEPSYLPRRLNIPVVCYHNEDERFDFVGYDSNDSAKTALDYLISLGHSRIAYLGSKLGLRGQAFLKIMRDHGMEAYAEKYMADLNTRNILTELGSCESAFLKLMRLKAPPSAILVSSDTIAFDVVQAAHRHSIKIPGQLSIIGVDDLPLSRRLFPALTTLKSAGKSFAELMLESVFNRLNNPGLPRQRHVCKAELVIRESCHRLN